MNTDTLDPTHPATEFGSERRAVAPWLLPVAIAAVVGALAIGPALVSRLAAPSSAPATRARAATGAAAYLDWPARGADRDDRSLFQTALDAWGGRYNNPTRAVMRPHADARLLFAQRYSSYDVVVLQGAEPDGTRAVAMVVVSKSALDFPYFDVLDVALPDGDATVSALSAHILLRHPGGVYEQRLFVLGDPATTSITVRKAGTEEYATLGADVGEGRAPEGGADSVVARHGDDLGYVGPFDGGLTVDTLLAVAG
jgi:hypothetical protein